MKPKQNKSSNKNNKHHKQQQQQQQQQQSSDETQQKTSVTDDVITTKNDDVVVTQTADTMTSSAVECRGAENAELHHPSNSSDSQHSQRGASTDHVTDRCADDVTSDVEVADILHAAPAVTLDPGTDEVMTSDPAVAEVTTSDPDVGDVSTELIMAKTFTESTHPSREFVPIRRDTDDVTTDDVSNPLPAAAGSGDSTTTLTVRCELVSQTPKMAETTSGQRAMTSSERAEGAQSAVGQLRDLTSEFRHLQSLLDQMTSPRCVAGGVDSSSEEELGDDWRQPSAESRVVYHYHLRHRPTTTRRWIRRTGDAAPEELNTQHQEQVVPRDEQAEEQLRTEAEELTTPRGLEHGDLKTQHQEQLVPRQETRLERGKEAEEQLMTKAEELTTPAVQGDSELGESEVLPVHEDPNTQHQELVVEDASVKAGDV